MDARAPGQDDDLITLPLDALRERVYAQGADETDERWIRAAAELTRRERGHSPAAGAEDGGAEDGGAAVGTSEADADATARPSRRPLAWAGAALVVGLLAGAGIATSLGGSATPSADATATPSAIATASAEPAPDPASVRSLLGADISRTSDPVAVDGILAAPQEEADTPPRSPGGDIDLTSIRGVQTSVGLYVARTSSGDACLLVYPWSGSAPAAGNSPGSGVASCAPPAQLAVSGLEITWIADVPARAFDGSVRMAGGGLSVVWSPDGTLTLSSPDALLAY
ncbi:hypothetical protein ACR8AL_00155 [Clavibacter sepedonicus]|uniref:Membrane protein n=1 Tax=Clavibacter sepedonicus TaxID=31964 RepID=B0RHK0_CLASE|nr:MULTISPECIES: hypothetical protein [Clavibacter]MBD5380532.1 hypothetical protein [Clavibacter sp.]OQJ48137.1 hypothetical protein B5P19_07465 [Clavibacter sepedonicus]OQJ54617.1 hypothetical protein B5P20_11315 [Clavibacter sepedonicus]UUK66194.1 hypothetical protein LRE50_02905 [Clavibacter sepedonicus]CAQ02561.1 putative membrane protein [Clavibacter sepedonicus]